MGKWEWLLGRREHGRETAAVRGEGEGMELTKKGLHCLARIVQSGLYTNGDTFYCCKYCLYQESCNEMVKEGKIYFTETVRKKLEDITGVYLGANTCNIEDKLLQNSFQATSKHVNRL